MIDFKRNLATGVLTRCGGDGTHHTLQVKRRGQGEPERMPVSHVDREAISRHEGMPVGIDLHKQVVAED